ncbi:MAG: hypothetical protein ACRDTA_07980 [Pseudonocardiaceae bacterium]
MKPALVVEHVRAGADSDDRRVKLSPSPDPRIGDQVGLPPVVEGLLVDVVADGFVLYCCGPRAGPNALVASYQWEHFLDLVTIRNFDRVTAARVPTPNRGQVDVFAPEVVVWARESPPQWTLQAMLNLLHPEHPEAPSTVSPAPRSLHVSRAEQRPLTIRPPSSVRADVRATRLAAALPAGSVR